MRFEDRLESFREMLLGKAKSLSYLQDWPAELDCESVVQDTIFKAFRARNELKGNSHCEIRAWLLQIFRNEVVSQLRYLRAQKRDVCRNVSVEQHIEESESRLQGFLAASESAVSARLQREEAMQKLYEAIHRMPNKSQQVLLKRYIGRLSMDEIAAELNISVDSANKRLFRAIENLSKIIDGETHFDYQSGRLE